MGCVVCDFGLICEVIPAPVLSMMQATVDELIAANLERRKNPDYVDTDLSRDGRFFFFMSEGMDLILSETFYSR
jgi:hypothetical protein